MSRHAQISVLRMLREHEDGRIGTDGLPAHAPLRGPTGDYFGHEWSRWRYDTLDEHVDRLVAELGEGPREMLDVGCATGERAADFARAGHRVTAIDLIDFSEAIADRNRALAGQTAGTRGILPLTFICGDAREDLAGFAPPQFDVIHARRVLNFMPVEGLTAYFGKVKASLKPNGLFAASFIAAALRDRASFAKLVPPGSQEILQLCPGMYAHHVGEVHFAMRAGGLTIEDWLSDDQVETGLIARRLP